VRYIFLRIAYDGIDLSDYIQICFYRLNIDSEDFIFAAEILRAAEVCLLNSWNVYKLKCERS